MLPPFLEEDLRNAPEGVRQEALSTVESSLRSRKRSARPVADPAVLPANIKNESSRIGRQYQLRARIGHVSSSVAAGHMAAWQPQRLSPVVARTTHLSLAASAWRAIGAVVFDRSRRLTSRVTHASEASCPKPAAGLSTAGSAGRLLIITMTVGGQRLAVRRECDHTVRLP